MSILCLFLSYTKQVIAKVFNDNVVKLHGITRTNMSDQNWVFTSHFFEGIIQDVGDGVTYLFNLSFIDRQENWGD